MPQKTVTTPLRSPNQTPFKAPLPTALKSRIHAPSVTTLTSVVQRKVNGIKNQDTSPSIIHFDFLTLGGGDLVSSGITHLKGFPTNVDVATRSWQLFSECDETYTDSATPANNYTASSTIVGGGQCPQATGYPSGQPFFPYPPPFPGYAGPENDFPFAWDVGGGDWKMQDSGGTRTLHRSFSSALDPGTFYTTCKADLLGLTFGDGGVYDDATFSTPNLDCSTLSPGSFSGALIVTGNPTSLSVPGAQASCGWQITAGISATYEQMTLQREMATLSTGEYYFWLGVWEFGLPDGSLESGSTGEILNRITFLSDGIITGGQSIGLVGDGATHIMPFPTDPFPIQTMGTNAIIKKIVFAVVGQSPALWAASLGLHMGDNF